MRAINLTPTWAAAVPIFMAVLENPEAPAHAKQDAREEIAKAAAMADKWIAFCKEAREDEELSC